MLDRMVDRMADRMASGDVGGVTDSAANFASRKLPLLALTLEQISRSGD